MTGVDCEALRVLLAELHECRTDYDGSIIEESCEPIGVDCGLLKRAEEAIAALLAKSAAYDALVGGIRELEDRWRQYAENTLANTPHDATFRCVAAAASSQAFLECAKRIRLLVSDDRPSHTAGEKDV